MTSGQKDIAAWLYYREGRQNHPQKPDMHSWFSGMYHEREECAALVLQIPETPENKAILDKLANRLKVRPL